jgi:DNA primase
MLTSLEEIKNRLDIVDILQGYLKLTKAGVNYKARCPFHKEKTPSFVVSPEKQIWHCFGCSKGGDIFKFIMEIENLEFKEALRMLAEKAGVKLQREDPKLISQREKLLEINKAASDFFEEVLETEAKEARNYLKERGLAQKTIKEFKLGYAPNDWRRLKDHLLKIGFKEANLILSGLIIKSEYQDSKKPSYDRFRSRVMFPIEDLAGHTVGFSGRIFPEPEKGDRAPAKYINSPNTPVYNKSRTLYGLTHARETIRHNKFAILVEGNLDVLMSHQAGVKNTLATCGTALNENHLILLKRYTDKLKLCFDQDEAGSIATHGAIRKALSLGFSIKIITFEGGKDPADIVLLDQKKWNEIVKGGEEFLSYTIEKTIKNNSSKTPNGKKEIAKEILPLIKAIANSIEQSHWVNKLAEILKIEEKYLYEALSKTKDTIVRAKEKDVVTFLDQKTKTRRDLLEENLVTIFLKYPQVLEEQFKDFNGKIILNEKLKNSFEKFIKNPNPKTIAADEILGYLSLKADYDKLFNELSVEDVVKEVEKITANIKQGENKGHQIELIEKIKSAEAGGNIKLIKTLIGELQKTFEE